jgi:apolipoprotein N-acyltransferase
MTKTSTLKPDLLKSKLAVPTWALALGSGIGMGLAPAPLNLWPLAWVTIVPLWILVTQRLTTSAVQVPGIPVNRKPGRFSQFAFFRLPLLWGIGYHGVALSWITGLHPLTWMGIPWLGSIAITLFAWGFITFWGAALVCCWASGMALLHRGWRWVEGGSVKGLIGKLDQSQATHSADIVTDHDPLLALSSTRPHTSAPPPWLRILVGTALWCSLETLWSFGSLNWTSISYTQSPTNLAILHLGQISGAMTVTAALVAVNGCLAEAWLSRSTLLKPAVDQPQAHNPSFITNSRSAATNRYAALAIALLILLHLIGGSLAQRQLHESPDLVLKLGMIQGNVPTRIKLFREGLRRAIEGYTTGYEQLVTEQKVDLVVTPEGAMPFTWQGENRDRNQLYQAVLQHQVPLLLGTLVPQGDRLTQSLITIVNQGEPLSRYNKVKLVPLGEYIPLSEWLGQVIGRLSIGRSNLLAGTEHQQFETPWGKAAIAICYETVFPELLRRQVAKGAEFIITVANLDPYSTVLMAQYQAHDVMRAIETDRWVASATNTGYSGIIDPHGKIHWSAPPQTYATHAATIYRRQTQTLYSRWGNWLTAGLVGASGLALIYPNFKGSILNMKKLLTSQ